MLGKHYKPLPPINGSKLFSNLSADIEQGIGFSFSRPFSFFIKTRTLFFSVAKGRETEKPRAIEQQKKTNIRNKTKISLIYGGVVWLTLKKLQEKIKFIRLVKLGIFSSIRPSKSSLKFSFCFSKATCLICFYLTKPKNLLIKTKSFQKFTMKR